MKVITYRDMYNNPAITATEKGHLFIITIDDIYLPYPIHKDFLEMIRILREAGYPAVLGVVTETEYADPQNVALLKELSSEGWEIATHTNKHSNLGIMEKKAPRYVFTEVSTSMDKIEKAIGVRPITLILPEGQMVNDAQFIKRAGIIWCVGINGGITYNSEKEFIYVGRESPAKTAEQTYKNMQARFGF
jgi:peptidoglycan/xylan/chitin deacetylase (PgdA/CDA1 family)